MLNRMIWIVVGLVAAADQHEVALRRLATGRCCGEKRADRGALRARAR